MLDIILSTKFKKDLRIAQRRGYDLRLLNVVVDSLAEQKPLSE